MSTGYPISRVGGPEHCQSATRLQQAAPPCRPRSSRCGAGSTVRERRSGINLRLYNCIPSQGHGQDVSAADSPAAAAAREYAQGAPGTERPYGPETASVAAEGKEGKRHFRQSHCHDPEMNAEAEGGKLSSQIKTDECTAWTCLPKILHDQCLRIAHVSVTSSLSAAACSSLRPCDPPARTPTPRRIRLS